MNILSIDSSTRHLSVAAGRDSRLLSEMVRKTGTGHMVGVMGMLDRVLAGAGLNLKDIDVFGVNAGPGDFTGTRIGISIIKTLSMLECKPSYGINSLDAFAAGMVLENINFIQNSLNKNIPVVVMPCLDVRRGEIYFAFYSITPKTGSNNCYIAGLELKRGSILIKRQGKSFLTGYNNITDFLKKSVKNKIFKAPGCSSEFINPKIIIGGNCYPAYRETLINIIRRDKIFMLDKKTVYPRARYLNLCVYYKAVRKVKTKNLVPVYVREFIPFPGQQRQSTEGSQGQNSGKY